MIIRTYITTHTYIIKYIYIYISTYIYIYIYTHVYHLRCGGGDARLQGEPLVVMFMYAVCNM